MDPFHQELPIFIYLYLSMLLGILDIKLGSNKVKFFIILFIKLLEWFWPHQILLFKFF